jgi:hypothetical protein
VSHWPYWSSGSPLGPRPRPKRVSSKLVEVVGRQPSPLGAQGLNTPRPYRDDILAVLERAFDEEEGLLGPGGAGSGGRRAGARPPSRAPVSRTPVILDPEDEALWLDPSVIAPVKVLPCLRPIQA